MSAAKTWALGDYPRIAENLQPAADELVAASGVQARQRLLDLAAGNGNVAVAAAGLAAVVTATDVTPRMVQLGRERTSSAGLPVSWHEADAQQLPFPDAAFDVITSAFGIIFVAEPDRALAEARRVLAPGGVFAFTAWPQGGFLHETSTAMRPWLPPTDAPDPFAWGAGDAIRQRLGGHFADVEVRARRLPWWFSSPQAMIERWQQASPSHVSAARAAGDQAAPMFDAVQELVSRHVQPDGSVRIDVDYLLALAW